MTSPSRDTYLFEHLFFGFSAQFEKQMWDAEAARVVHDAVGRLMGRRGVVHPFYGDASTLIPLHVVGFGA